jgi:hypothetical protein
MKFRRVMAGINPPSGRRCAAGVLFTRMRRIPSFNAPC